MSDHECKQLVNDVLKEIADDLDSEDKVTISNIGTFTIRHKNGRMGRNPETGEQAVFSAHRIVVFKPSYKLKRLVDEREK